MRITLTIYIITILLMLSKQGYSQLESDDNFEVFNNKITLMPYFTSSKLRLDIRGEYKISYRPDKGQDIGLYGSYKKFGFGIGLGTFDGLFDEPDNKVRFYDFRLNYYGRKIGVDGQFQFYRSFLVEETMAFNTDSLLTQDRPNQKLNSVGINAYYNFNEQHSFKAIYNHTERQLKSNGAFLLGLLNRSLSGLQDPAITPS